MSAIDRLGRRNHGWAHVNKKNLRHANYGKELDAQMGFMLTKEQLVALEASATKHGVSRAERLRTFITWGLEQEGLDT